MAQNNTPVKALVLAGGGARGSYQVGVWRALIELGWRPQIITGTSVGSLNGAMFALDLYETARDMWLTIRSQDVICPLYTSPSPRDRQKTRMPSSAGKKKKKKNTHETV